VRSCEWLGAYSGELVDGDDLLGGDAHERQQLVGAGQQVFGCHVALRQPLHASHGDGDGGGGLGVSGVRGRAGQRMNSE
jgi:hypothetical protein